MKDLTTHPDWDRRGCKPPDDMPADQLAAHVSRWFVEWETKGVEPPRAREARLICQSCPMQADCLRWAHDTMEHHGIFGGVSPEGRRQQRRRKNWSVQMEMAG